MKTKIMLLILSIFSSTYAYSQEFNNSEFVYEEDRYNSNDLYRSFSKKVCYKAFTDIANINNHSISEKDKDIYNNKCTIIVDNPNYFYRNLYNLSNSYGNINNFTIDDISNKYLTSYTFLKYNYNNNILFHNNYIYLRIFIQRHMRCSMSVVTYTRRCSYPSEKQSFNMLMLRRIYEAH